MKTYQSEKNCFRAHLTDFLPSFGRALLIAAVDFKETCWFADHFLLTGQGAKGASIESSYNPLSIPKYLLPDPEDELKHGLDIAEAILTQLLFAHEKVLLRQLVPLRDFISPRPLTETQLARLHLRGEFTAGLCEVRDNTRCSALKEFLSDVLVLEPFQTQGDRTWEMLQLRALDYAYSLDEPEYTERDLKQP